MFDQAPLLSPSTYILLLDNQSINHLHNPIFNHVRSSRRQTQALPEHLSGTELPLAASQVPHHSNTSHAHLPSRRQPQRKTVLDVPAAATTTGPLRLQQPVLVKEHPQETSRGTDEQ